MAIDPVRAGRPDPATPFPLPVRGQIITYVPSEPGESPVLNRGTATGGVLTDPVTGSRWLPVIRPDLLLDLVDVARVVVFDPVTRSHKPPRDAAALRQASRHSGAAEGELTGEDRGTRPDGGRP